MSQGIPRVSDQLNRFRNPDLTMTPVVSVERTKVLVIDSHPFSRMTTKDLLCLDGHEVLEIEDASEVIVEVLQQKPDLILLDERSGLEVCQQLKSDGRTRLIPVILTTVTDDREMRHRCKQMGGDDLLLKPFKHLELSNRVRSLIEQKRLYEGLSQIEQVLFAIARAIENRFPESDNSCTRLASLVQSFGEYLHLPAIDLQNLRYASYLHDIGTVAIPDEIMLKKGGLTPDERVILQKHVVIGEEICQSLPNRQGVLPIIRHHHERWDGSGYPDELRGDDIPWLAQVFQILDIYVALTSKRPHKECYSLEAALEIIKQETARGWRNPKLAQYFIQFIQSQAEK
jgi:putative two-component system response regulator